MTKYADVKSRVGDKCYCHNLSGDLTCFVCWEAMNDEIARLREAIRNESARHEKRNFYVGMAHVECPCDLCRITREGR
jgi:hypothetical protein